MIVPQQAAESLATGDGAVVVRLLRERHDEPVAQALVIGFVMIMVRELAHCSSERRFPDQNQSVHT